MVDGRKRQLREAITGFIIDYVLQDEISYESLNDLRLFCVNEYEEYNGLIGALCEFFGLGVWFQKKMEECEFDVEEFYLFYEKEIERRAD